MKVLIVTDYFYPHWTGISKSIYNLVTSLQSKIHFTVLTVNYTGRLKSTETLKKIKIIRTFSTISFSRSKFSLSLFLKAIPLIRSNDVVFINSPSAHILPIALLAKVFKKKLLIFHQGDLILPNGFLNRIIEKIFDISSFISFSIAHKVATYTRDYAEHSRVLKPFLKKFSPLIMPIYLYDSPQGQTIKILQGLKNQKKILFGFGGRFVEEKGFDILFKAIPKVMREIPNAHFIFAGEIKMEYEDFFKKTQALFDRVRQNVTIMGLLDEKELAYFYKMIDFIVIPSRSDCFPLFQAEAMLAGKPSIVSDIPGARFLVRQTGFGLVFASEDPRDLVEKLIDAAKNRDRFRLGQQKVSEILNNTRNAEAIRKYIEE
ncbi:glycosyltransferase family 4 protein [Candidatus Roizmanbacteria bacterium]|nr:glycosyltransferase family 4 protein [Candidatus Roizmanbacteria bacterium]